MTNTMRPLWVVVQGNPAIIQVSENATFGEIIRPALAATGHEQDEARRYEARDGKGSVLNWDASVEVVDRLDGRVFLNLRVGTGG